MEIRLKNIKKNYGSFEALKVLYEWTGRRVNKLLVKRQSNKWTGLLTKALTDNTDEQNKQIFC